MSILLALIGCLLLFAGFLFSSSATAGVYLAACACFFGILARLAQANDHQRALMAQLNQPKAIPAPGGSASDADLQRRDSG